MDSLIPIFENLDQLWIILGVIAGVVGTASGWVAKHYTQIKLVTEKALNKDLAGTISGIIDLMSSDVPQTAEQTALITDGIVPGKTWKMTDDTKTSMLTWLRAKGGEFTRTDLDAVIAQAEWESQVEYAVVIVDHNGEPDMTVDHAFVSYGIPVYDRFFEIKKRAADTSSKTYYLETKWVMLEAERDRLISEIGTSYPKCIAEAIDQVNLAETNQTEHYYINCNNRAWEIYRGNIVRELANPDDAV
jgi:hypothetical protein